MAKRWTDKAMEQLAADDRKARLEVAQNWLMYERRKLPVGIGGGDVADAIEELQSMVRRSLDGMDK